MSIQLRVLGLLLAGFAFVFVACEESTDEAAQLEIDQENICEAVAEVMCHNMFACCTGKEREIKLGEELTITERECVDDMILECENEANDPTLAGGNPLQAAANGSFSFDLERANACVDALMLPEDGSCFVSEVDPTVYHLCFDSALGEGLVAEEGDCFWDWECAGSAYCSFDFTCVALPAEDAECSSGLAAPTACAAGLACNPSTNICTPIAQTGEECIESFGDTDFTLCDAAEAFCLGEDDTTVPITPGTCSSKFPLGATCESSSQCAVGICQLGYCEHGAHHICQTNDACSQGLCTGTEILCYSDLDCAGATCEKSCVGNVCYEEPTTLDFCQFGLDAPCYVFGDDPDAC